MVQFVVASSVPAAVLSCTVPAVLDLVLVRVCTVHVATMIVRMSAIIIIVLLILELNRE